MFNAYQFNIAVLQRLLGQATERQAIALLVKAAGLAQAESRYIFVTLDLPEQICEQELQQLGLLAHARQCRGQKLRRCYCLQQ